MSDEKNTNPSAIIIPFGKHKGKSVAELLVTDPAYADWATAQGWFAERYAELHAAIISRGAGTDDTPEHNNLQARFLEPEFREVLVMLLRGNKIKEKRKQNAKDILFNIKSTTEYYKYTVDHMKLFKQDELARLHVELRQNYMPIRTAPRFEVKGADVVIDIFIYTDRYADMALPVELKPTLGDDYPSVMRQMERLKVSTLLIGTYTGRGASEPQMRAMFKANGKSVVFVQEIDEVLRAWPPPWHADDSGL